MRRRLFFAFSLAVAAAPCVAPALAQDASAQDANRVFTGSGATQARACAAAQADAQAWVERGKVEGRRRGLVRAGNCACTPTDGQLTCRIDAQVRDAAYEEEEER